MKWWYRVGCFLTGWNPEILKNSSEASRRLLARYTSALMILIILWAFIGYCFTSKYVKASELICSISAFIFALIIIQIERQIILANGKNNWGKVFRISLGVIMAVLGSAIIDQYIFRNDIDRQMVERRNEEVAQILPKQLLTLDKELSKINFDIDSVSKQLAVVQKELYDNPTISIRSASNEKMPVTQENGTTTYQTKTVTTTTEIPNPRTEDMKYLQSLLSTYRQKQELYVDKKMKAEENLRAELESKTGFLEELNAMIVLMGKRWEAIVFYGLMFLFFFCLELFVLITQNKNEICDYDMAVEHQLKMRAEAYKRLQKDLLAEADDK